MKTKSKIPHFDVVIVGGGLSGCLLFYALRQAHPHIQILLLEKENQLGGNHTWSFHDQDCPENCRNWLRHLISFSWDSYDVKFPGYQRTLSSSYHCIRSKDLHSKLLNFAPHNIWLNSLVTRIEKCSDEKEGQVLEINHEKKIQSLTVIHAKGWPENTLLQQKVAWQKFVGLEVKLKKAHQLKRVLLKDATVPQIDGYRFFYILPFSETVLLIEDTYYSNHSILKTERIEQEIYKYANSQGWEIESVLYKETGCLPLSLYPKTESRVTKSSVPFQPDSKLSSESIDFEIPQIGAASGFVHPVTGYTLPQTLLVISNILKRDTLNQESIKKIILEKKTIFMPNEKYFRFLNRMLFLAADPLKRYIILERFYKLNPELIQRFYSGQLTFLDQFRILFGKPPVSIIKALNVISEGE